MVSPSPKRKCDVSRQQNTQKRYKRISAMFYRLYNEERKRIDDVEAEVTDYFGISLDTLNKALKSA